MPCHIPEVAYGEEEEPIVLNSTVEKKKKTTRKGNQKPSEGILTKFLSNVGGEKNFL